MPCYTPLKAWKGPGGQITFSRAAGWSDRPIELPCGKCVGCRERRARDWALRCVHEASMHQHNSFITLTYRDECIPDGRLLRLRDLQLFFKRLRKRVGRFRYFACGEYGSRNLRPHYHALVFGQDFCADRVQVQERPYPRFFSAVLEETWGLGRTDVGSVTYESAAYVARYVHKGSAAGARPGGSGEQDPKGVDCLTGETVPEFLVMSRGGRGGEGGIGTPWLKRFHRDVYPSDEVVHDGFPYPVPRFYDEKVVSFPSVPGEPAFSDLVEEAKEARSRASMKHKEDLTGERLAVRERCAVARLSLRQRNL